MTMTKMIAELEGRGYTNIEHDMDDAHANYFFAKHGGESYEVKIEHDGDISDRIEGNEDWNYIG